MRLLLFAGKRAGRGGARILFAQGLLLWVGGGGGRKAIRPADTRLLRDQFLADEDSGLEIWVSA